MAYYACLSSALSHLQIFNDHHLIIDYYRVFRIIYSNIPYNGLLTHCFFFLHFFVCVYLSLLLEFAGGNELYFPSTQIVCNANAMANYYCACVMCIRARCLWLWGRCSYFQFLSVLGAKRTCTTGMITVCLKRKYEFLTTKYLRVHVCEKKNKINKGKDRSIKYTEFKLNTKKKCWSSSSGINDGGLTICNALFITRIYNTHTAYRYKRCPSSHHHQQCDWYAISDYVQWCRLEFQQITHTVHTVILPTSCPASHIWEIYWKKSLFYWAIETTNRTWKWNRDWHIACPSATLRFRPTSTAHSQPIHVDL